MIELKDVGIRLDNKFILERINLVIKPNQCTGIIGRNGAGKTTLFKTLTGLLEPTTGEVLYGNIDRQSSLNINLKKQIGVSLDDSLLIEEFNGFEYLYLIAQLYDIPKNEIENRIHSLGSFLFDQKEDLYKHINTYSTGMKKRMMLAAALIHQPAYLLLDEPLTGLDPFSARKIVDLLEQYATKHTVLISSHDLSFIERCCPEIVVLENGQVHYHGKVNQFTSLGSDLLEERLFKALLPKDESVNELNWLV